MKTVLHQLGRYKRDTLLCIGLTTFEVIMEILLPFITSIIIDQGLEASNLPVVYRYGILMVVMAFLSLVFGAPARVDIQQHTDLLVLQHRQVQRSRPRHQDDHRYH